MLHTCVLLYARCNVRELGVKITDFCNKPVQAANKSAGGGLIKKPSRLDEKPAGGGLSTQSAAYGGG